MKINLIKLIISNKCLLTETDIPLYNELMIVVGIMYNYDKDSKNITINAFPLGKCVKESLFFLKISKENFQKN